MQSLPAKERLHSLDQFRGFTVWSMLLVNFVGGFDCVPALLKHHNTYCSLADVVMPCFLFAVGFAFRLTFGRRAVQLGLAAAYMRVTMRLFGLALLAVVIYSPSGTSFAWSELGARGWAHLGVLLKREWFQALMHIAATSLWLLPVIRARMGVLAVYTLGSAVLHLVLSHQFNFHWTFHDPSAIDGGPLGFLTWTLPAAAGAWACHVAATSFAPSASVAGVPEKSCQESRPLGARLSKMILLSVILAFGGWALSCLSRFYDVTPAASVNEGEKIAEQPVWPNQEKRRAWAAKPWRECLAELPFTPPPSRSDEAASASYRQWNYWMMSQRGGTLSYLLFASGCGLFLYAIFHLACDHYGKRSPLLETMGRNALAAYVLHEMTTRAFGAFAPNDSPAWYAAAITIAYLATTYLMVRSLERNNIYIKL